MEESLLHPKKWAKISRIFFGRTQHQIKNRFISLLSKGTGLTREKIRKLINKNQLNSLISRILEELREKEVRNEEKEENRENLLEENDFNVDDFINSQSEIQRFGEFEELG